LTGDLNNIFYSLTQLKTGVPKAIDFKADLFLGGPVALLVHGVHSARVWGSIDSH